MVKEFAPTEFDHQVREFNRTVITGNRIWAKTIEEDGKPANGN